MSEPIEYPAISVILPVYNGELFIAEAINSILRQSFDNFELIIINDGSTDSTERIIKTFNDTRVIYTKRSNYGLAATLNHGISISRGKYIARQDHDDISHSNRLKREFEFLESNPEVAMVGTWAEVYKENKSSGLFLKPHCASEQIKFYSIFNTEFVHSSVMIRKCVFDVIGLYTTSPNRQPPEDYELWSRITRNYKVANIPEVLIVYREVCTSITRKSANPFSKAMVTICAENIKLASSNPSETDKPLVIAKILHSSDCTNEVPWNISPFLSLIKSIAITCFNSKTDYSTNYKVIRSLFIRKWLARIMKKQGLAGMIGTLLSSLLDCRRKLISLMT